MSFLKFMMLSGALNSNRNQHNNRSEGLGDAAGCSLSLLSFFSLMLFTFRVAWWFPFVIFEIGLFAIIFFPTPSTLILLSLAFFGILYLAFTINWILPILIIVSITIFMISSRNYGKIK